MARVLRFSFRSGPSRVLLSLLLLAAQSAPALAASLRFLATADSGSGDANQRAVGLQMARIHRQNPVELVIMAGDNIYPSGDLSLLETTMRRPYRELIAAKVPFHAVLGNHDIRSDNGNGQLKEPLLGMKGRWYVLRRGPVDLFMIDTNVNADWKQQLPWLQGVLAASRAPWKVVVGHHPIVSSGLYGDDRAAQRRLGPLFERYGVQLYINGHEHHYERSVPIRGTTYLIVGGGGAALRPVQPRPTTARALSRFSFAELDASDDSLTIRGWDAQGQLIDQTRLSAPTHRSMAQ
ncbi:MAG: putative purple acid phosphatase [Cyanobacteriota bacterium]|jgi:3',5'-cyclic AMP phosphodiesterase CpdA